MADRCVMGAPLNAERIAAPGAVVANCDRCHRMIVFHNRCPSDAPRLCPQHAAEFIQEHPTGDILTPSGLGSIFAVNP